MPQPIDLVFAVLFAVVLIAAEQLVLIPRWKRRVRAGPPSARRNGYRWEVIGQWTVALVAIALWARAGRSWADLRLVPPTDWHLAVGFLVIAAIAALWFQQYSAIKRTSARRRSAIRPRLASVELMLPHTRDEYFWFTLLSCTAGVCEEILYRGYLMWLLASYVGVPAAFVGTNVLFGAAHLYQGVRGGLKAAATGVVFSLIVLGTGWLIPAMVVHALLDANAGTLAFAVLEEADAVGVAA